MRKAYVILIYVFVLLLASIGVGVLVWSDVKGDTISEETYKKYNEYKENLLNHENYSLVSDDLDINVYVNASEDSYLVSTVFANPKDNYKNLIILVIDVSEKEKETNKIYPSIGIIGNYNNEFVISAPNKKTTHSRLVMNYESSIKSEGVLIYLEYTDSNNATIISRISVSVS